jgi:transcriptional regulator with XRE-family HTH domain
MSSGKHSLLVALGKRIQANRKRKGWTQTDMAIYLDLSRGHISDIERGKREVGIITLQIIARGFGMSMSRLLKGL